MIADAITCFNIEGIDPQGKAFSNTAISLEANRVLALWVGVAIPTTLPPDTLLQGIATVGAGGVAQTPIDVRLTTTGSAPFAGAGDHDPSQMTRLRWLNSELYTHDSGLVPPYLPIQVLPPHGLAHVRTGGLELQLLNRVILIGPQGLPT